MTTLPALARFVMVAEEDADDDHDDAARVPELTPHP
jgi:hypothetical protein